MNVDRAADDPRHAVVIRGLRSNASGLASIVMSVFSCAFVIFVFFVAVTPCLGVFSTKVAS